MPIEASVEDWRIVKKRWEAWWDCDIFDRVVTCISAPRDGVESTAAREADPKTRWTDVDYLIRSMHDQIRNTWYGGEGLPLFYHGWSVGHSLMFGCKPHFAQDTIWVEPVPRDGLTFEEWEDHPWWTWILEATKKVTRASRGEYFVLPVWGNHAGDNLALICGSEQLAMDVALDPDWVAAAVKRISDILMTQFDRLWELVQASELGIEGSVNYCGCWSPGKTLGFDCDISCMVSPDAFQRMFLPPLVETMHSVDHRIYHLDGPCALHHLDALLDLPELHAIQWVPGAGQEEIMQWVPLLQRIQTAGKAIQVSVAPDEVEPLMAVLRREGLCLCTRSTSEGEGRRLLERVSQSV
ncbi:MAG: hypothetical protein QGI83_22680 [Candidatus Latescibacteria bacterium]|nr:hypothetical protein [Candidatus Latescibacterota bacterium]